MGRRVVIVVVACAAMVLFAGTGLAGTGNAQASRDARAAASTCAVLSTSVVGSAIGVAVRAQTPTAGGGNRGYPTLSECSWVPVHGTPKFPADEVAMNLYLDVGAATSATLSRITALVTKPLGGPPFVKTKLKGIGTTAVLATQKTAGWVYVVVLVGHTLFYAWSQDAGSKQVVRVARAAAHAL